MHIAFVGLHQYSYWKVGFSDAGYFSTYYKSVRVGEVEEEVKETEATEQQTVVDQTIPAKVVAPKKIRYEIYDR